MQEGLEQVFLKYTSEKLLQLAGHIETCAGKLSEEYIWMRGSEHQNAVGNLVLHLCGNVRQWIGHGVGGQNDVRERDLEFANRGGISTAELRERLRAVTSEAAEIIRRTPLERLPERVTIQGYSLTVFEAILHVIEHFSHHTGQILFATKLLTGEDLGFYRHLNQPAAHGETIP
jgi:uncharacterized damage-inducible protein DinB